MKYKVKNGFTIIEVSILFVIFLIVALLIIPLSLDDTIQTKNEAKWRDVQQHFSNISYAIDTKKDNEDFDYNEIFASLINSETKTLIEPYKITYKNGTFPSKTHRFTNYNITHKNAVLAYKFFPEPDNNIIGIMMYDVNGPKGPNMWGRDVFGFNIYEDRFEPFCKNKSIAEQKQDCSKNGNGLCCSSYYLSGGRAD